MNYRYLLASISFAGVAYLYYKLREIWLEDQMHKGYKVIFPRIDKIKDWFIIILVAIFAIVYFFKWLTS